MYGPQGIETPETIEHPTLLIFVPDEFLPVCDEHEEDLKNDIVEIGGNVVFIKEVKEGKNEINGNEDTTQTGLDVDESAVIKPGKNIKDKHKHKENKESNDKTEREGMNE